MRPTPDKGHIVIDLEAETINELKENLKEQEIKNMQESKVELWKRIIKPVQNMADICSNDKKVFKSLISNIKDEIVILGDLNVTNDIDMATILQEITTKLTTYTPGQIKNDKRLKTNLGKTAQDVTNTIDKYMNAGGNSSIT